MVNSKWKAEDREIGIVREQNPTYVYHPRTYLGNLIFDVSNPNVNIQHLLTYED